METLLELWTWFYKHTSKIIFKRLQIPPDLWYRITASKGPFGAFVWEMRFVWLLPADYTPLSPSAGRRRVVRAFEARLGQIPHLQGRRPPWSQTVSKRAPPSQPRTLSKVLCLTIYLSNQVCWSWSDLCERAQVVSGGGIARRCCHGGDPFYYDLWFAVFLLLLALNVWALSEWVRYFYNTLRLPIKIKF